MTLIRRRPLRAAVAGALLATGFVLGSATAHAAAEDPRATRYDGNASTCADAKLAGTTLAAGDYTHTRGKLNDDQYLDIVSVSPDITVTGIVVKAGNAFNVYEPGKLGLSATPPWTDLRAPVTGQNDNIPQLSHWFVCGVEKTTTTSTTATTTSRTGTTTTTTTATTSSNPVGTTPAESSAGATSSSPAGGGAVATTGGGPQGSPQNASVRNASDLAHTGFDGGWLIGLGAALVLGGAALVFLVRARRKA